ncbi:hypothetical protein ASE16_16955 [Leifsonia sp. Root227]|uniref:hypothetical protein n=1 Tax=unclassified Leifsonia TaxID=2663824 RepID=UPI0006F2FC8C|nr:hypothetical protein [Leifsonia sp. Root227]KRC47060.1 hypothetical protein ASE16_16955 [Leifsonia sp. Root227]
MRGIVVWALLTVAVVLVVIGGAVLLFVPATFGWTAYSPLSSSTFSGMYPLTEERAIGATCAIVGLLIGAGLVGWGIGRRSASRPGQDDEQP